MCNSNSQGEKEGTDFYYAFVLYLIFCNILNTIFFSLSLCSRQNCKEIFGGVLCLKIIEEGTKMFEREYGFDCKAIKTNECSKRK